MMATLDDLVANAHRLVSEGYYRRAAQGPKTPSLIKALKTRGPHVIAEVKFSSPAKGSLADPRMLEGLLSAYVAGGAHALSVLTEPHYFGGSLDYLRKAALTNLPTLMKDIVVDPQQIHCGAVAGASSVLLIQRIFDRGLSKLEADELIRAAHGEALEVLLEVNTLDEYDNAVDSGADLIGINNRDLDTMEVDVGTTLRILQKRPRDRPIVAMSGIESREDLLRLKKAGANAFLVGSSLMASGDPRSKLKHLLEGGHG